MGHARLMFVSGEPRFLELFLLPLLAAVAAGGILALFFGGLRWSCKKHLAVTLPLLVLSFGAAWIAVQKTETKRDLAIAGAIVDESSNQPVGQALVTANDGSVTCLSEDNGNFVLNFKEGRSGAGRTRIHVSKAGYRDFDGTASWPSEGLEIQLHHL